MQRDFLSSDDSSVQVLGVVTNMKPELVCNKKEVESKQHQWIIFSRPTIAGGLKMDFGW